MNQKLEAAIMLAYREIPPTIAFSSKLYDVVKQLGREYGNHCDVKMVSSAHLGLEDENDFFIIKLGGEWRLVRETYEHYRTGTAEIPNAIYIEHEGRYAFVVGDYTKLTSIDSKEVPPL